MTEDKKNNLLAANAIFVQTIPRMEQEARKALKEKIISLIDKYEADIAKTEKMTKPVSPENSIGRVSRMDAINNKSVMEASLRNKISKRNKLKLALTKVDQANFGLCARCKRAINPARLMFMPESAYCINCADKR